MYIFFNRQVFVFSQLSAPCRHENILYFFIFTLHWHENNRFFLLSALHRHPHFAFSTLIVIKRLLILAVPHSGKGSRCFPQLRPVPTKKTTDAFHSFALRRQKKRVTLCTRIFNTLMHVPVARFLSFTFSVS